MSFAGPECPCWAILLRGRKIANLSRGSLSYDEWGNFLGNPTMVDALLSRVRHYCHTLRSDGPSLRDPQG